MTTLDIPEHKILIVGNRSYKNLGDELILLGTIKLLQAQKKQILVAAYDPKWLQGFLSQFINTSDITFLTEIPKGIRSGIKYLQSGKRKERKQYRQAQAIIIGGGEILTEENPNSYRYRLISLLPCLTKKIPWYLMGGIQVPKKNINTSLFTRILSKTKKIFARDHESIMQLATFGYKEARFFMDTAYYAYDRSTVAHKPDKKHIIINLNKNGEHFLDELISDIRHYHHQGYTFSFVPVSKGNREEYADIHYYHQLQDKLKRDQIQLTLLDREADFDHFVQQVAHAELVISSRLHLFLIASFLGTKTKVYPYQKKILKMQKTIKEVLK